MCIWTMPIVANIRAICGKCLQNAVSRMWSNPNSGPGDPKIISIKFSESSPIFW
jgi:hypothetical protein